MDLYLGKKYVTGEGTIVELKIIGSKGYLVEDIVDPDNFWWVNSEGRIIINGDDLAHLALIVELDWDRYNSFFKIENSKDKPL